MCASWTTVLRVAGSSVVVLVKSAHKRSPRPIPQPGMATRYSRSVLLHTVRNIVEHLPSGNDSGTTFRLVKTQEHFFQARLVDNEVDRIVPSRYFDHSMQCTLNGQVQIRRTASGDDAEYPWQVAEPLGRGRSGEAEVHVVLFDVLERGDLINSHQFALADDAHVLAGVLDLRQVVRGEKDRLAI